MRYIRYAFLGGLGIVLVSLSLANRDMITLRLMPDGLADFFGFNMQIGMPVFAVVLGGVAAGLVIGFMWEWLREYKHRRRATDSSRQVRRLEREITRLKDEKNQDKDEVLAILDEAS